VKLLAEEGHVNLRRVTGPRRLVGAELSDHGHHAAQELQSSRTDDHSAQPGPQSREDPPLALIREQARVSFLAHGTGALNCELCTAGANIPTVTVVVGHPRGGVVQLAACDWCVQAVRRLAAVTGGHAAFALGEGSVPSAAGTRTVPSKARPVGPPVMVLEFPEHLRDPEDGRTYVPRVYGQARADGTWAGWIEFIEVGAAVVLRTDQETTQSSREGVAYWASGLEPTYLEGAFARARRHTPTTVAGSQQP
jgi:hypothetical protein